MAKSPRATLLVVDDEVSVTESFARMLTLEGYDVRTALDAQAALREIELSPPDAILLDLRMPLLDGLAFLRRLRARERERPTPVAIITGDYLLDDPAISALREMGATLYFKPVWAEDLVRITEQLLRMSPRGATMHQTADSPRRPTLLLVDDCAGERDLYELTLESKFRVRTATRGDEGLALAAAERPDVVVLDVMMPGLDGWETCTRIKSDPVTADIPVILLTGADDRDLSQHAMAVGATALLRKPCPADRLLDTVFGALAKSSGN